jgi:hypothetical protein
MRTKPYFDRFVFAVRKAVSSAGST